MNNEPKNGEVQNESPPLPIAQRREEIDEQDFALLIQIAENAEATAGRLKKIPKRIPLAEGASTQR
jgi:hypothetical protein